MERMQTLPLDVTTVIGQESVQPDTAGIKSGVIKRPFSGREAMQCLMLHMKQMLGQNGFTLKMLHLSMLKRFASMEKEVRMKGSSSAVFCPDAGCSDDTLYINVAEGFCRSELNQWRHVGQRMLTHSRRIRGFYNDHPFRGSDRVRLFYNRKMWSSCLNAESAKILEWLVCVMLVSNGHRRTSVGSSEENLKFVREFREEVEPFVLPVFVKEEDNMPGAALPFHETEMHRVLDEWKERTNMGFARITSAVLGGAFDRMAKLERMDPKRKAKLESRLGEMFEDNYADLDGADDVLAKAFSQRSMRPIDEMLIRFCPAWERFMAMDNVRHE